MTAEQNMLLASAAKSLTGRPLPRPIPQPDWQKLARETRLQAMPLVVLDGLKGQRILMEAAGERLVRLGVSATGNNMRIGYDQQLLVKLLKEHQISYVILKGEASAAYYPDPSLRALGDVDFLVDPRDMEKVSQILQQAGFQRSHENHICHQVFTLGKSALEMHFSVPGVPNGKPGEQIRDYLSDLLSQAVMVSGENGSFCAPAPYHHGLILLMHMQHHMLGEGIGLRHLCDWGCFVERTWKESFWQERLLPLLQQVGLLTYAGAMTATAELAFGTACPQWAQEGRPLAKEILADILSGGNFGRKDPDRAASGVMISNRGKDGTRHGRLYYLYKALREAVREQHPKANRYPVLLPFYMLYRTCRYLLRSMRGERPGLRKMAAAAMERKSLYARLHIYEGKEL